MKWLITQSSSSSPHWSRSWSRNGPNTGPHSSVISWVRVGPARASVRTTWSSSNCSAKRSLTSPVARWPRWRPSTSKTGNWKREDLCVVKCVIERGRTVSQLVNFSYSVCVLYAGKYYAGSKITSIAFFVPISVLIFMFLPFSMCNEFSQIFQLCQFVMVRQHWPNRRQHLPPVFNKLFSRSSSSSEQENSQNAPLVHATLETLLRFLNWIPLGYIFETKLISTLVYKVNHLMSIQQIKTSNVCWMTVYCIFLWILF